MPRSHHRKKHKAHLRQFKEKSLSSTPSSQTVKARWIVAIAGAIAGFCISFFASQSAYIWIIIATLAGGLIGYYVGKMMGSGKTN